MELVLWSVVAVLAIVLIVTWRRAGSLDREIAYVRRRGQDQIYELAETVEDLKGQVRRLSVQVRPLAGDLRFTPDIRMDELIEIHEAAPEVLAGFHIGGCASCAVEPETTIAEAASERGVPVETLLTALNALVDGREPVLPGATSGLLQIQSSR